MLFLSICFFLIQMYFFPVCSSRCIYNMDIFPGQSDMFLHVPALHLLLLFFCWKESCGLDLQRDINFISHRKLFSVFPHWCMWFILKVTFYNTLLNPRGAYHMYPETGRFPLKKMTQIISCWHLTLIFLVVFCRGLLQCQQLVTFRNFSVSNRSIHF